MHHHPVLVRNINHLTDARYFAAMNVDWMSIPLNSDPASFSLFHTLKDWVEGIKLAAEINTEDEALLAKTIIDASPDGIISSNHATEIKFSDIQIFYDVHLNEMSKLPEDAIAIISYHEDMLKEKVILNFPSDKLFLQAPWTIHSLKTLLDSGYKGGICFAGEAEDKTGIRDYGMMDELLEILNR